MRDPCNFKYKESKKEVINPREIIKQKLIDYGLPRFQAKRLVKDIPCNRSKFEKKFNDIFYGIKKEDFEYKYFESLIRINKLEEKQIEILKQETNRLQNENNYISCIGKLSGTENITKEMLTDLINDIRLEMEETPSSVAFTYCGSKYPIETGPLSKRINRMKRYKLKKKIINIFKKIIGYKDK